MISRVFFADRTSKQVLSLYTSMILGIVLGVGVSVVNTRLLGPQQYGDLKFLQNLFGFSLNFLTLGVFVSGSRLLAHRDHEAIKHHLMGSLMILAVLISIIFMSWILLFSSFSNEIFKNNLAFVLILALPLLFVFPFQNCLESIMQGDNRIYELSAFKLIPSIGYLLIALSFNFFMPLTFISALMIQMLSLAIVIFIVAHMLKPKFTNIRRTIALVWKENRTYGFPVYLGIIAGVASAQLGGLTIGYYIDTVNVGYFSLAMTISMPLAMIPSAVGTTLFKEFANSNEIPLKATIITIILSIFALLLFLLIIKQLVILLYSKQFLVVVPLIYIVSIGCVIHGFGDYMNRFLGAHGMGRQLRNGAIAVGLSNVFGYTLLVYKFGIQGAALTQFTSAIIYCSMMFIFYKQFRKAQMIDNHDSSLN